MSKRRKRLCIITPTHWKAFMGGAQFQVKCILDELLPLKQYDVTYLANWTSPDFLPPDYDVVSLNRTIPRLGYLMHAIPMYHVLCKLQPNVIYQRVGCGYTGIATFYARRHGARLIWHVSSDSDVMPKSSIYGRNLLRRFLEKRSIEYGIRHANHIVTQTRQQANLLRKYYHRSTDAVIPNFHPTPLEEIDKSGPLSVVWVANLKPLKKPEVFVRLAAALSDLKGVRFKMIGDLVPERRHNKWSDTLMKQIEATSNLEYVGRQSQNIVNQFLAQSHVFVNTSLHEGFPNTFIQAWMRKVPVVSLHVNPDSVFDRERVGIHAGSEERLCQAVRQLLTDRSLRQEYGTCASSYAARRHSVRNAHLLAELIETGRVASEDGDAAGVGTSHSTPPQPDGVIPSK